MARYATIELAARRPLTTARASAGQRVVVMPLILIMFFATAVSVLFLSGQSLRLDESQSLWQTGRGALEIFHIVAIDVHVPLYHETLHFWRLIAGNSVASARLLSLLFLLLSIPAIYRLGHYAYSHTIGLYAALLMGISPFMLWYGSEIRMYTMFMFFTILNQYFYLRILRREPRAWRGYCITALLGVYSHYFFLVNLAAQAAFFFLRRSHFPRGSFIRFAGAAVLCAAALAPWVWYVLQLGQAGFSQPLIPRPTTVDLFNAFSQFLFGFQDDSLNTFLVSLWPVTVVFAFLTLRKGRNLKVETEYLILSALFCLSSMFFGSFVITPVFLSRYLIFVVPTLFLLLANLFESYPARVAQGARFGLVAVMLATLMIEIGNPQTPVKENYAGAVGYIEAHETAGDAIIVSAPFTLYPVEYYYRGPNALSALPVWDQYAYGPIPPFSAAKLPGQISAATQGDSNVWVLLSYDQGYEKDIKNYFDDHYQRLAAITFSKDLNLYEYRLQYN